MSLGTIVVCNLSRRQCVHCVYCCVVCYFCFVVCLTPSLVHSESDVARHALEIVRSCIVTKMYKMKCGRNGCVVCPFHSALAIHVITTIFHQLA